MITTKTLFESRKSEIEFYYKVLHDVMSHAPYSGQGSADRIRTVVITEDNGRFIRIMKSNFLLMLYNLIESCVKSGFEEIYEALMAENVSYTQANNALRDIWSSYEISKAYQDDAGYETYGRRVKAILEHVVSNEPVALTKKVIEKLASGNLDAKKIRELFKKHDIDFMETNAGKKEKMFTVKNKRNLLAHGDESFDEAARGLTLEDLENTKKEVLIFVEDAIRGIELYYNDKLYCKENSKCLTFTSAGKA